ncbi:hypothetical protein [Pseudomonas sp. S1(2024)]|uniref:hypothetical protein n=1 Tax=Pseudomonas sp. S1(2024) TaxID=3390191 RepID=UPI00397A51B7
MTRNILILGTSNSLLKGGWVDGLREALPGWNIQNRSIGASPGIQFAASLNTDFSSFDYVFFDSVPNDEEYQYLNVGYSDIEFSTQILFDIFSTISAKANLIVLGICNKRFLDRESEVYSLRRYLASACGADFIDVRELFNSFSGFFAERGGSRDLYEDHPSHPLAKHMFFLGGLIGACLKGAPAPVAKGGKCYKSKYLAWDASMVNGSAHRVVERSNSLLSERFVLLEEGESLSFELGMRCIGLYVNYRGTNAVATLSGQGSVSLDINLFSGIDDRVLKLFVPIPNGIDLTRVSVKADAANDSYTPMMFKRSRGEHGTSQAQISHAVFVDKDYDSLFDFSAISAGKRPPRSRVMSALYSKMESEVDVKVQSEPKTGLVDNFGRYIYFDAIYNRCLAVSVERKTGRSEGLWPVSIQEENGSITLFAEVGSDRFKLSVFQGGIALSKSVLLGLVAEGLSFLGTSLQASEVNEKRFTLNCGGKFLSCQPDGAIVCDRTKARDWEEFQFCR